MHIHKDTHIYLYLCNMDHTIFITVTDSCKKFTNLYEEVQKIQSYLSNLLNKLSLYILIYISYPYPKYLLKPNWVRTWMPNSAFFQTLFFALVVQCKTKSQPRYLGSRDGEVCISTYSCPPPPWKYWSHNRRTQIQSAVWKKSKSHH